MPGDLHTHSSCSDGSTPIEKLPWLAACAGLDLSLIHIQMCIRDSSDTAQAARILERTFHENNFSIQDDHNLRLHNLDLPVGKIVTAFVENGLEVSEAHTCEESLEDYFKRVTGGEGIA